MKLNYYAATDSLYIDLSEQPSVESREISEGIVLDYDAKGNLVGIDIDNASRKVELEHLLVNKLPSQVTTVAAYLRSAPDAQMTARRRLRKIALFIPRPQRPHGYGARASASNHVSAHLAAELFPIDEDCATGIDFGMPAQNFRVPGFFDIWFRWPIEAGHKIVRQLRALRFREIQRFGTNLF